MSAANDWDTRREHEKRNFISTTTMYYFVYHINTIALYWEEKPTSLTKENKWNDKPRITIVECVGADSEDGKMRWIMITKATMVVIFTLQNYHLLTLSLPCLLGKRPKSVSGKSSSCRFSFSAERNANTKATEYVTFGFFLKIGFLPLLEKFEPHRPSAIRSF